MITERITILSLSRVNLLLDGFGLESRSNVKCKSSLLVHHIALMNLDSEGQTAEYYEHATEGRRPKSPPLLSHYCQVSTRPWHIQMTLMVRHLLSVSQLHSVRASPSLLLIKLATLRQCDFTDVFITIISVLRTTHRHRTRRSSQSVA